MRELAPRPAFLVFAIAFVLYALTAYGGIRSPDGEAVYRVAESLARHGSFAAESELDWRGFGLSRGVDGRLYSIFGPLLSLAEAPLVAIADRCLGDGAEAGSGLSFGPSFHVGDGIVSAIRGEAPSVPRPHALRFAAAWANVFAGAGCVAVFFLLAGRIAGDQQAAYATTLLYGAGSLAWPYAGSDFSEPLTTLCALLALYLLARSDSGLPLPARADATRLAGLSLGLAILSHVTAVLFVPFFAGYALTRSPRRLSSSLPRPARWSAFVAFAAGLGIPLAVLALYNWARFGSPLETGRALDPAAALAFQYGHFVPPGEGLYGLLVSSGKGLLFYCPAVVLGLVTWSALHRRQARLSALLAGAALARLVFLATRSDWHGGFALGPRLLVPIVPFLLLPVAAWLAESGRERYRLVGWVTVACTLQQLLFSLGEVIGFLHLTNRPGLDFAWGVSPLLHLWRARPAPWWLAGHQVPIAWLWLAGAALLVPALGLAFRRLLRDVAPETSAE